MVDPKIKDFIDEWTSVIRSEEEIMQLANESSPEMLELLNGEYIPNYDLISNEDIEKTFEKWFNEQIKNGLTNFHVSINENCKDPIAVKREILKIEQRLANGDYELIGFGTPDDDIPVDVRTQIDSFHLTNPAI